MADERIDIEVNDKVSPAPEKKLRAIGDAAGDAHKYVERLKAELASMNTSQLVKLQAASNSTTRALAQQMNAQARLTVATQKAAAEDAKAALMKQRLATEAARTEAAQARAAAATARAAKAQQQQTAAATVATQATTQAVAATKANTAALQQDHHVRARLAAQQQAEWQARMTQLQTERAAVRAANAEHYQAAMAKMADSRRASIALAARKAEAAAIAQEAAQQAANTAATNTNTAAKVRNTSATNAMTVAKNAAAMATARLTKSLGAGVVASNAMGASVRSSTLGLGRFVPLAAASALVLGNLNKAANEDSGIKEYVNSLGLTAKELKKLEDQHVTYADTAKATWTVLSSSLLEIMGFTTDEVKSMWDTAMSFVLDVAKYAFIGIGAGTVTLVKFIGAVVANIGKIFYNAGVAAKNLFLMSIQQLVNNTIDGINLMGDAINWLSEKAGLGNVVKQFQHIDLGVGGVTEGMLELSHANPLELFNEHAQIANNNLNEMGKRIRDVSRENAKARLGADAQDLIDRRGAGPKPKKESDPKTQLDYIKDTTTALDNELSRMRMLKDEREVQNRLDQIQEEFLRRRMPLEQAQLEIFREKIQAIQDYKYVQTELDRIVEEVQGPQRTYNATLEAASDLLNRGVISLDRYNQELGKAGRALSEATDPMFKFREELDAQERALGLYGEAAERNNYLEGIRQELVNRGFTGDALRAAMISDETKELVARNEALRQQNVINSSIAEIVNPMLQREQMLANEASYYSELQRLRDDDVINEQQYQQSKYALDAKFREMKLEGASSFFSELAGLQSSSSRELAAIGKAAAVAEATIKGYLAVQNALATVPPPFNIAAAAAIAVKTGANVAAIMSTNVGNFQHGGSFMVEGRSGVDNNNINMNVSRGERVTVETPAQQRANDNGSGGTNVEVNPKIVNMFDEREFIGAMDSEEGEEVIMNIIRRRRSDTNQILGTS